MLQSLNSKTDYLRQRLLVLSQRPVLQSPKSYFDDRRMAVARSEERLYTIVGNRLEREKMKLFAQNEKLKSLDPLSVLGRGFSVAFGEDGKAIRSISELPEGKEFELLLADGKKKAVAK